MRAAVCAGFGGVMAIEALELRAPLADEVRVAVRACAICHSDIMHAEGAWGGPLPVVYGHEAAGVVEAVGESVRGFAPGDRVAITMIRACGQCHACKLGRPTQCQKPHDGRPSALTRADGSAVAQGFHTAAFAEAVVVHHSQVVGIPADIPMEAAALLACGGITGAGAVLNTAQVEPGAFVVVIGAGGVGLNTVQAAHLAGAARVIAVDLADDKLEAARGFGATDAVRADHPKLRRAILDLTEGRGADYVFVTAGAIAAYQGASALAARGGAVVAVGMPPSGAMMALEPVVMAATSQRMLGSNLGNAVIARDIPMLAGFYRQGRFKLDELITERFPLERINEAIAAAKAGAALRNVLVMGG